MADGVEHPNAEARGLPPRAGTVLPAIALIPCET